MGSSILPSNLPQGPAATTHRVHMSELMPNLEYEKSIKIREEKRKARLEAKEQKWKELLGQQNPETPN